MNNFFSSSLGRLRLVGILEGVSYIVLLICTTIKYTMNKPEFTKVPGMIHGALFVLFVLVLIDAHITYKWSWKKSALAFLASLVPFGNFWADLKLFRD
jgi:integral membrane protein